MVAAVSANFPLTEVQFKYSKLTFSSPHNYGARDTKRERTRNTFTKRVRTRSYFDKCIKAFEIQFFELMVKQ